MLQELKNVFGSAWPAMLLGIEILALILSGLVVQFLLLAVIRFILKKAGRAGDNLAVRILRWPLRLGLPVIFIAAAFPFLEIPAAILPAAARILITLFIAIFALLVVIVISVTVESTEQRLKISRPDSLRLRKIFTQIQIIKRIASAVIVFIAAAVILLQFEGASSLGTTILVSTGVIGIIIGFAAQRSIGTLLAGFQIAFSQPIRLDDVVFVENEWGRVEEITLTYVVVRLLDQRRLILPITYFMEKPFQNWTRHAADLSGTVLLSVDYTAPLDEIRERAREIVSANPLWDRRTFALQVSDARERSLELRVVLSAADSLRLQDLRCQVREELVAWLAKIHPECLPRLRASVEK